jgi:putative peptidoglycan lipid II flippase
VVIGQTDPPDRLPRSGIGAFSQPRRSVGDEMGATGRNTALLAGGTFLSRVTGFLRVVVIGTTLGLNGLADAYNLANTVPNIIYELILGGVLSATMIPVFVEQFRREDREAGNRSVSAVLTAIVAVLVVVTAILEVAAPVVIHFYLLFNHQATGGDERTVATSLLRLFAPQVFFLGAIVVTTALLNARRHFGAAAFSPVVNNLISIAAILATKSVADTTKLSLFRHDHSALLVLGVGTTVGYVIQFAIHLPALARAGIRLRPVWDLHDPAVRQVTRLSTWLVGVVLANQVSLTIILILADQVGGHYSVYQSAYTFFQLPYALFAVSVASVLTPDLAERWSGQDILGFRKRMISGTRVTMAVLIPAGIGYALVARPVITLALHHGAVSAASSHLLGSCLTLFALGLPGYSAFLLLMRGFQAMQDARAMFRVYLLENALSVALSFALYPSLGVRGLCLAWVAPYTLCSFVATAQLQRRMGSLGGSLTVRALVRIGLSTAVMAAVIYGIGRIGPANGGDLLLAGRLIAEVIVGTAVYVGAARLFGVKELNPVLRIAARILP